MRKSTGIATLAVMGAMLAGSGALAGTVTQYTDATSFGTAMGVPLSVEDFGNSTHYPITSGTLSSTTNTTVANGTPITPGMILPGVTYSTPIGVGNFFNIDLGLYFDHGFLDRSDAGGRSDTALTTTFDQNVKGFGFVTSPLMGTAFSITIHFASGPDDSLSNIGVPTGGTSFFGFISDAADITSATIYGNSQSRAFAIDDFTYPSLSAVPEPSSIIGVGLAMLAGAAGTRRRGDRAN